MVRFVLIASVFSACALISVCSQQSNDSPARGIEMYNQNKLEEALPYFETAAEKSGAGSETFAYLAETYRRLDMREEAQETARNALSIDPCNSFAHNTLSYLYNPMFGNWDMADREKAWDHIQKGIECDPGDGNIWLAAWTESIYRGNQHMESKSLKRLIDTEFLTTAILKFNRWMLKDLPPHAILLTNGDMDTYPAVAMQEKEGLRSDVAIINYSLLNTRWYQKHVQNKYNVDLPLSEKELNNLKHIQDESGELETVASQIMNSLVKAKAENSLDKPLAIAITVGDFGFAKGYEDYFVLKGPYKIWIDEEAESYYDAAAIEASLKELNLNDFAGPFVSKADRSPVRTASTKLIASNFTDLAMIVVQEKIEANEHAEAMEMLSWARRANEITLQDPETVEELRELEQSISMEKE